MVNLVRRMVGLSPYDGKIQEPFNGITAKMTLKKP
jgi:hypothetical protein